MLALLNWFGRSHQGWSKLTSLEGVKVLFPNNPLCKYSQADSPLGPMNVSLYSSRLENSRFSVILSVRDFMPGNTAQSEEYFEHWKNEFQQTMQAYQIQKTLVKQSLTPGQAPRLDLLYSNADGTTFTRVSLISQGTRLIILFAVGMLQEISGPACTECFRSIRL